MATDTFYSACLGSLVSDAVSMPVHWYYDREALRAEYGEVTAYPAPWNPHAGSILWRSHYTAPNEKGEILQDQAVCWGQRGVHYHQFLQAGENTLNFHPATEPVRLCEKIGGYDPDRWLARHSDFMLAPGSHRDTCVEEYHRSLYLAWKYHDDFDADIIANPMVGGATATTVRSSAHCLARPTACPRSGWRTR